MTIKVTQKNTRQTPRKVRLVANQVKQYSLPKAIEQLGLIEKRATLVILKTIRQAIANATHNHGLAFNDLELENILITEGPRYKRFRAVSRGRAHGLVKRTSHVTVILKTTEDAKPTTKSTKVAKPVETKSAQNEAAQSKATTGKSAADQSAKAQTTGVQKVTKASTRVAAPKTPRTTNK
jgi:large subunit ribosomal protein L22